jgi:hypothetical protein
MQPLLPAADASLPLLPMLPMLPLLLLIPAPTPAVLAAGAAATTALASCP